MHFPTLRKPSFSVIALFLAIITGHAGKPASVQADRIVYPTGQASLDIANVQAALDQGGIVLLKATNSAGSPTAFDFGPSGPGSGFVYFTRDAELIGERLPMAETTINGGEYPIYLGQGFVVAVRNINFTAPFWGALQLFGGAQVSVTGNHISQVVGRQFDDRTYAEAIVVGFAGKVNIEGNVIDSVMADRGLGVSLFGCSGPVDVLRNRIRDTTYGAIECGGNTNFQTGEFAVVRVQENVLRPGGVATGFGVGIQINAEGDYYIARNEILVESAVGYGIFVLGAPEFGIAPVAGPVVERNKVAVRVSSSDPRPLFADGIDLVGSVSHAYIGQNSVEGMAFSALGLYNMSGASDLGFNTLVGNEIANCNSTVADVFLDSTTHDTVLKGKSGSVIDLGINNHITGFGNVAHSASGQQVSEAAHRRMEAAQNARDPHKQAARNR